MSDKKTLEQIASENPKLMAELVEVMNGIEHFSDALNFRNDHLSKALREWIAYGSSLLSKLGLQDEDMRPINGWKLVPEQPTPAMISAAKSTTSAAFTASHATEIYVAMLAASALSST
jgi:hypothetical protein